MPKTHSRKETNEAWQPNLIKRGHSEAESLRIDFALEKLVRRLDRGAMTANQINQWHEDLASYPVEAIEYAFDFFGKNATNSKYPKPKTIADLCESWWLNSSKRKELEPGCERCQWTAFVEVAPKPHQRLTHCACVKDESLRTANPADDPMRRNRGYGINDIMYLWKLYNAEFAKLGRILNEDECELLYQQVDKQRGQVPAWRA